MAPFENEAPGEGVWLPEPIAAPGVVAICRGLEVQQVLVAARALREAGVRAVEVTLDSPDALRSIAQLAAVRQEGELVGCGTVLDLDGARAAVDAGAQFLVMPHTDPVLIAWAIARRLPVLPGVFTATEVVEARRSGATTVKWFPASAGGPAGLAALRGPFPDMQFVATGGIGQHDVDGYIRAGAAAVAMGGWLFASDDPAEILRRGMEAVAAVVRGRQA